jgi:hypothetical protein
MKNVFDRTVVDELEARVAALTPAEWNGLLYKHLDHHLTQFGV